MYYNGRGERVSRRRWEAMYSAFRNRQEFIGAGLTRRDLLRMGLLTGAGMLIAKNGLSARGFGNSGDPQSGQAGSPWTDPFTMELPIPATHIPAAAASLTPAPSIECDATIDPLTGLAVEGRTKTHQAPAYGFEFPASTCYQMTQQACDCTVSNQLPVQRLWGYGGTVPGPTFVAHYGKPVMVRNVNRLPADNGGFGSTLPTTHLHNGHTPSESDGHPVDGFRPGQFYDHYYPNVYAGFRSTHPPFGDVNEAMSTLWYHDHALDFTAANVYKGLAGFYLLFNEFDTGDETSGFRLPSYPQFDIPMMFGDRIFDARTGMLAFDNFNIDGVVGDKFLVNGVIQPFMHVSPRRYRLRWLNTGPSRVMQLYVTDPNHPAASNPFWQISTDGNLMPTPVQVPAVALGPAERADVIVDFSKFAGKTIYLENRLEQVDGRKPTGHILPGGQGNLLIKIIVDGPSVVDRSVDPATLPTFYSRPSVAGTPAVVRRFEFGRSNGQWTINNKIFDGRSQRFTVTQNTLEEWRFNGGNGWEHPIHIHYEEFQIIDNAPGLYGSASEDPANFTKFANQYGNNVNALTTRSRKDVVRLGAGAEAVIRIRPRDWAGSYVMHCHNVLHEDHAMMLQFDVAPVGDKNERP